MLQIGRKPLQFARFRNPDKCLDIIFAEPSYVTKTESNLTGFGFSIL